MLPKGPTGPSKVNTKTHPAKPKAVPKKVTPSKPSLKGPRRGLTSESSPDRPSKASRKRTASESSPSQIPEYDLNVTTQAARNKKRFKLTRASLFDESINERSVADAFQKLDSNSLSNTTWGNPIEQAIKGFTRKKTGCIVKKPSKRASGGTSMTYAEMMEAMRPAPRVIIHNSPDRSGLLRIPLEIREQIYCYLLTYPKPILVKHDWQTVERNPYINHALLHACRQLNSEGTFFLYRMNTIQAVFRKPTKSFSLYEEPAMINSRFISYFRNVIIDCSRDCWNLDWFEKASNSIQALTESKAVIVSLTLVVVPQRVGMSSTAVGMETSPVTFADFTWYSGDFMASVRKLAPREFKIIIKKGAIKRLLVSIDLRYLEASGRQQSHLVNQETLKLLVGKERRVDEELMGLKDRFEEIFEDDEWAVQEGKCKLLCVDSSV